MSRQTSERKRGAWTPNKDDIEAFRNGALTTNARRIERAVDDAFNAHRVYLRARSAYRSKLSELYTKLLPEGGCVRLASVDGRRQVTWSQRRLIRGNANAERANVLIQDVAGDILGRNASSDDERTLAAFLQSVIQRTQGRIIMNANLVSFTRLQFSDPRLVEAQKLLRDAFDVTEGSTYAMFEVYDPDKKKFVKAAWDEQGRQWLPG